MSTAVMERTDTEQRVVLKEQTTDQPGSAAHIVMTPRPDVTVAAYLLEACIEGNAVEALCGWTFVPSKDVKAMPICEGCRDIYQSEDRSDDSGDGTPDGWA